MTPVLVPDMLMDGVMNVLVRVLTGAPPRISDAAPSYSVPGFGVKKGGGNFQPTVTSIAYSY